MTFEQWQASKNWYKLYSGQEALVLCKEAYEEGILELSGPYGRCLEIIQEIREITDGTIR